MVGWSNQVKGLVVLAHDPTTQTTSPSLPQLLRSRAEPRKFSYCLFPSFHFRDGGHGDQRMIAVGARRSRWRLLFPTPYLRHQRLQEKHSPSLTHSGSCVSQLGGSKNFHSKREDIGNYLTPRTEHMLFSSSPHC